MRPCGDDRRVGGKLGAVATELVQQLRFDLVLHATGMRRLHRSPVRSRGDARGAPHHAELMRVFDQAHLIAKDVEVGQAVVFGQALVKEGVITVEQFQQVVVLSHDMLENLLGLLAHGPAQSLLPGPEFPVVVNPGSQPWPGIQQGLVGQFSGVRPGGLAPALDTAPFGLGVRVEIFAEIFGVVVDDEVRGRRLADRGWTLAISETGTGGALTALLGELPSLVRSELNATGDGSAIPDGERDDLEAVAGGVRRASGADVGLSVAARPHGGDTQVSVAVVAPSGSHRERRLVFQRGAQGRSRAALTAASILLRQLASSQPSMPTDHALTAVQPETVR